MPRRDLMIAGIGKSDQVIHLGSEAKSSPSLLLPDGTSQVLALLVFSISVVSCRYCGRACMPIQGYQELRHRYMYLLSTGVAVGLALKEKTSGACLKHVHAHFQVRPSQHTATAAVNDEYFTLLKVIVREVYKLQLRHPVQISHPYKVMRHMLVMMHYWH